MGGEEKKRNWLKMGLDELCDNGDGGGGLREWGWVGLGWVGFGFGVEVEINNFLSKSKVSLHRCLSCQL